MRRIRWLLLAAAACCLLGAPAWADWLPGDGHKMHFPQLPDPNGWDVDFTTTFVADDWRCTSTGAVGDIHFWLSAKGDLGVGQLGLVWVNIYPDIPDPDGAGPAYSRPDRTQPLWSRIFNPGQYQMTPVQSGVQGWYSPWPSEYAVVPGDHQLYWQVNITDIVGPFVQQLNTIYWLELHVTPPEQLPTARYGWKTSLNHFNDDAVWLDPNTVWQELRDPLQTGQSLDMAFVITPEPASLTLLTLLALPALGLLRRRRM